MNRPAPSPPPAETLPPELLAIIEGLARRNARRDYAAAARRPDPPQESAP